MSKAKLCYTDKSGKVCIVSNEIIKYFYDSFTKRSLDYMSNINKMDDALKIIEKSETFVQKIPTLYFFIKTHKNPIEGRPIVSYPFNDPYVKMNVA
jgi:hypothetical protein